MMGWNFVLSPIQSRQQTNQSASTSNGNAASSTADLTLLLRMCPYKPLAVNIGRSALL